MVILGERQYLYGEGQLDDEAATVGVVGIKDEVAVKVLNVTLSQWKA